jgi:hypothetical protein
VSVTFLELERWTSVAPLGVRFWDRPTAQPVWDGLRLVNLESGRRAAPNRAGVFVATGLPGLRDAERGAGDEAYWSSPPGRRPLGFELVDTLGRFHDIRFDAEVPFRGVFEEDCGFVSSPPAAAPPSLPLFSLPSRPVPPGTAAVRAELTDAVTGAPAVWAVLEVTAPGVRTARGIADREGRVLVLLPYPEPPWHGASPPPGSRPLSAQTWTIELAVRYSPDSASPPLRPSEAQVPPDLCTVLTQLPAELTAGPAPGPAVETDELAFGRELTLNQGARRTLLVTQAA